MLIGCYITRAIFSLEECRYVVVLQHSPVVVEQRQAGARVDVEVVGGAGVVQVVDYGGEQ